MVDFTEIAGLLSEAILSEGLSQTVTLTRQTAGARNTSTGIAAIATTTQYGSGVEQSFRTSQIDGSLIRVGDKKLLLLPWKFNADGSQISPATALTAPVPEETLVTFSDGSVWSVRDVKRTSPNGIALIYTLHIRTGG